MDGCGESGASGGSQAWWNLHDLNSDNANFSRNAQGSKGNDDTGLEKKNSVGAV